LNEVGLGILLDQVCGEIVRRAGQRSHATRLLVHPVIFRCVAEARAQEVARGLPLLLLGLELVPSEEVPPSGFKMIR
jgi:hypothetical protein